MDLQKTALFVSIQNSEFQRDFHYFITVKLDNDTEIRRTDVSAFVSNPVFATNSFFIPLPNFKIDFQSILHFEAFILVDRDENMGGTLETKGEARIIGESNLELGPLTPHLTEISGSGIRQALRFTRMKNGKEQVVGKFVVLLKLVGESQIPIDEQKFQKADLSEIFHQLPNSDPTIDWRVRIDIRSAVDMPLNRNTKAGLPTCFMELGWTLYDKQPPDDLQLQMTNMIPDNRHPLWNQQFFISNPLGTNKPEGFIYLCARDRYIVNAIDTIYIPLQPMKPFVPYHFEFCSSVQEYEARGSIFVSMVLEMKEPDSFVDQLVDIVVHNIHYDPLPLKLHRMMLVMTTNSFNLQQINYVKIDLKGPTNIAKIIEDNSNEKDRVFLSTIMKIPPIQIANQYNAVAVFTVSRKLLDAGLMFLIAGRDDSKGSTHSMPNCSVGRTDVVDPILQKLLLEKEKAYNFVPVSFDKESSIFSAFTSTKCRIELSCKYLEPEVKTPPRATSRENDMVLDNDIIEPKPIITEEEKAINLKGINFEALLAKAASDKEKWEILSRELAQKQELIHRLIRESDDKTESLKITGADIVDLRRQIKMLQSENTILRKKLAQEEQIEIASLVTKEISRMGVDELRTKIVKLAQAYRDERVRNEDFERALKAAQKDIAETKHLQAELEILQKKHTEVSKRLLAMQQEASKMQLYKDTIKKQEKVIAKLEKIMEQTLKDTQKSRNALVELEKLRTENIELQKKLKKMAFGPSGENSELERYKSECYKLEQLVAELKEELKSKRPMTTNGGVADWEREKMDLEVQLHNANSRVEAIQQEMTNNARNFAREISQLKIVISEKQALLDSVSHNF